MSSTYLIPVIAGLALVSALLLAKYPVAVAVFWIAAAAISEVTGIGREGLQVGVTIYPADLACLALIASCVSVSLRTRSLPRDFCWPALILLGLGVLNFVRGALMFGIKASGNGARDLINLILPALVFSALGAA